MSSKPLLYITLCIIILFSWIIALTRSTSPSPHPPSQILNPQSIDTPAIQPLSANSDYIYAASNSQFTASFANKINSSPEINISTSSQNSIGFSLLDARYSPDRIDLNSDNLVFKDIQSDIDLKYSVLPNGIKEEIIIHRPISQNVFRFNLNLRNLTPVYDATGRHWFLQNQHQHRVLKFLPLFAIDAALQRTDDVTLAIDNNQLVVTVPSDWLSSPDRQYPIIVDPSIVTITSSYLHDNIMTADTTPEVRFTATDLENDSLVYEIEWATDSSFSGSSTAASDANPGFSNLTTTSESSPFTPGDTIAYTFQSALTNNTTYFYRIHAKDPGGSNTYAAWSQVRSLTINTSLVSPSAWSQTHADQFATDSVGIGLSINNSTNSVSVGTTSALVRGWSYTRPISITNSDIGLTNTDVLLTLDTAALISAGRLQSDCDDLRFQDSNQSSFLSYWIEGGCNTNTTQIWVRLTTLPAGESAFNLLYGNSGASAGETSYSGSLISLSSSACPAGTTRNTSFDARFPYGSATYGTTGGSDTHSHASINMTSAASGSYTGGISGSDATVSSRTHTHTIQVDIGSTGHIPSYSEIYFCNRSKITAATSDVLLFNSLPSGWNRYTALDGRFPRGANGVGATGGSMTHINPVTGGYTSGARTGTTTAEEANAGDSTRAISTAHTHTTMDGLTDSTDNTPSYYSVIYAQPASTVSLPQSTITLATALPPFGWDRFTPLDSRLPLGSDVGGTTGGSDTHQNTLTITTSNASATSNNLRAGSTNMTRPSHSHSTATTTDAQSNFPAYLTTLYIQKKTSPYTLALGTEIALGTTSILTSTSLTAADIYPTASYWREFSFNSSAGNGSLTYRFYYNNAGTLTLIPNTDLANNSTGFTSSPVSLAALSTTNYPLIHVQAQFQYGSTPPVLSDWQITLNSSPAIPSAIYPENDALAVSVTPTFQLSSTDLDADYLRYKITICTDTEMTQNCQTYDQTSSQTGWSGQNAQTNTAYTSGSTASYTPSSPLSGNTVYYWQGVAIDPGGTNNWSDTPTSPYVFSTGTLYTSPTNCRLQESTNDTWLKILWTDTTSTEAGFQIWRSVDGAAHTLLTSPAANSTSYQDNTVSSGHTYSYRVRSYITSPSTSYSGWCTAPTADLHLGSFRLNGVRLNGIKLN